MGQRARAEELEELQVICSICASSENEARNRPFTVLADGRDHPGGIARRLICFHCMKVITAIDEWMDATPGYDLQRLMTVMSEQVRDRHTGVTAPAAPPSRLTHLGATAAKRAGGDASAQFRAPYVDLPYRGK
jgi:hypothetical protein